MSLFEKARDRAKSPGRESALTRLLNLAPPDMKDEIREVLLSEVSAMAVAETLAEEFPGLPIISPQMIRRYRRAQGTDGGTGNVPAW